MSSLPSLLNYEADYLAVQAQTSQNIFYASVLSFCIDPYTFHSHLDRWIKSNIRSYIDWLYATHTVQATEFSPGLCLQQLVYNLMAPLDFPYLCALSCFSAVVQLYACSGQLPTAFWLHSHGKVESNKCQFAYTRSIENEHHIFIECPHFHNYRQDALKTME